MRQQAIMEDLQQSLEVGEHSVHASVRREEVHRLLHELQVAGVGEGLVLQHHQQRSQQVTHALRVAILEVSPHVCTHNVPQLGEVPWLLEEPGNKYIIDIIPQEKTS